MADKQTDNPEQALHHEDMPKRHSKRAQGDVKPSKTRSKHRPSGSGAAKDGAKTEKKQHRRPKQPKPRQPESRDRSPDRAEEEDEIGSKDDVTLDHKISFIHESPEDLKKTTDQQKSGSRSGSCCSTCSSCSCSSSSSSSGDKTPPASPKENGANHVTSNSEEEIEKEHAERKRLIQEAIEQAERNRQNILKLAQKEKVPQAKKEDEAEAKNIEKIEELEKEEAKLEEQKYKQELKEASSHENSPTTERRQKQMEETARKEEKEKKKGGKFRKFLKSVGRKLGLVHKHKHHKEDPIVA